MFFFFFFQTNAMQSVASSQQQWKVFLPFYSGTALHVNVNMLTPDISASQYKRTQEGRPGHNIE